MSTHLDRLSHLRAGLVRAGLRHAPPVGIGETLAANTSEPRHDQLNPIVYRQHHNPQSDRPLGDIVREIRERPIFKGLKELSDDELRALVALSREELALRQSNSRDSFHPQHTAYANGRFS